jgi:FkbM family methyltransferase
MSALGLPGKILRILATEGRGGIAARIRRRWRLWSFRPQVLEKQYDGFRFRFYIGTTEGQEWYGKFVDTRLYKPVRAELAWLARAAAPGDLVADVGAHHGYFSLLLSHWVGAEGKVYAFECLPENAEIAARNVALNGFQNMDVVRKAVGARSGTVEIVNNSGGILGRRGPEVSPLEAEMIALDEFFPARVPDLLKIDVEGYEFEVLKGARRCLAARPKIALEFHCFQFADPVAHVERVLGLLPTEGYHYQIAYEAGDELVDYAFASDSPTVIGRRYNPHLYGLPTER